MYVQSIEQRDEKHNYPLAEKYGRTAFNLSLAAVIFIIVIWICIEGPLGLAVSF